LNSKKTLPQTVLPFIAARAFRVAFVLLSKIYRQMYADTGIATDSERVSWSGALGTLAGQTLPPPVCGTSHARACRARTTHK
jgi:hypothetical protein